MRWRARLGGGDNLISHRLLGIARSMLQEWYLTSFVNLREECSGESRQSSGESCIVYPCTLYPVVSISVIRG